MCSWLLVASIFTLSVDQVEKYFQSWLQATLGLPFGTRTNILDCIIFGLLDRDMGDQVRLILENSNHHLPPSSISVIASWYADQDDIKSSLALLDKVSAKSAVYLGTPAMFGFLLRYCQRKKDPVLALRIWERLKKTKITLTTQLFNEVRCPRVIVDQILICSDCFPLSSCRCI